MKKKKSFYPAYTLAMAAVAGILILIFAVHKKSFIWGTDGIIQHYTSLAYWGNYLRGVIKGLLFEHRLRLPMWDLHIGYGADILTTLHYYVIGDPLNLLAVFVPERYTEYLYNILILVRIYLAGAAFSRYCFYHKNDRIPTLLGSVIYAWSQWIIVAGPNHPYFINPCIYLPLLLLGVDKIYDGKKPYNYIFIVALAGVSNFYFFYMLGIFAVVYAVFRYIGKFGGIRFGELRYWLGKFGLYSLTGIFLSGVILVPVLMTVVGTARMGAERYTPFLYSPEFYQQLLAAFAGKSTIRYSYIGVASVCVLSLLILFMQKKKYMELKAGVILVTVLVCVPFFGRVLNGFSYVSNRWSWAASMLFAYIFVKMYPEFFCLTKKQRITAAIGTLLYICFLLLAPGARGKQNAVSAVILLAFTLAALSGYDFWRRNRRAWALVLALGIFAGSGCNLYYFYAGETEGAGRVDGHVDAGTAYKRTHDAASRSLKKLDGIGETRYEQNNLKVLSNAAMLNGLNSGRYYFSIAPEGVGRFFEELHMQNATEQNVINLDSRAWLLKLFSTGYYTGKKSQIPYGFEETEQRVKLPKKTALRRDREALPLAYTYDEYISSEKYEEMNAAQRQEALMQGVVLEESGLPEREPEFESVEIPYTIEETEDIVKKENGGFVVKKSGAQCIVSFRGEPDCETLVTLTGLRYNGINAGKKSLTEPKDYTTAYLKIATEGAENNSAKRLKFLSVKDNFQCGRKNFGANLGYREEPLNRLRLTFEMKGDYDLGELKILCQKMTRLSAYSQARRENAPTDLVIDGNHMACSVDFGKPQELVFAVPYSRGWSIYVDGKKQPVHEANRMFLGTEISEGRHQVEAVYRTPYLGAGALLSLAGVLLVFYIYRKNAFCYTVSTNDSER